MKLFEPAAIEATARPDAPAVSGRAARALDGSRSRTALPTLLGPIDVLAVSEAEHGELKSVEEESQEAAADQFEEAQGCYEK